MSRRLPQVLEFSTFLLLLTACASTPEEIPAELQKALVRHDHRAVLNLIDHNSRPLVEAMLTAKPNHSTDFGLEAAIGQPTVTKVEQGESGLTLTVAQAGRTREWVLVRESGAWKLDLSATAARRAWDLK